MRGPRTAREQEVAAMETKLADQRPVAGKKRIKELTEERDAFDVACVLELFAEEVIDGTEQPQNEIAYLERVLADGSWMSPDSRRAVVRPPSKSPAVTKEDRPMTAEQKVNELIEAKMADGLSRAKAHAAVMKENPELRQAWVAEANASRKPEDKSAPPSQAKERIMAMVADKVADGVPYSKAYADTLKANPKLHQQWIDESQPGYKPPAKPTAPKQSAAAAPPLKTHDKTAQEIADAFLEDRASRCI